MGYFIILADRQRARADRYSDVSGYQERGAQGTIGGKSESMFQGKPGFEDKLAEVTKWSAITFMVLSAIVTYIK